MVTLPNSTLPLAIFAFALLAFWAIRFITKFIRIRSYYKDVPGLPHDPIWGHMKGMGELTKDDRHFDYQALDIWRRLNKPPFFYLDIWPAVDPNVVIIADAALAESLSKATPERPYSFPKSPTYEDLRNLTGSHSIIQVYGEEWKELRRKYNPGFNSKHLQSLLPEIIEEVKTFASKLDASVGKVITLGDYTRTLTIDIICSVVLGHNAQAQVATAELTTGFKGCLDWQLVREKMNPFHIYNPVRPIALYWYERKLNNAIDKDLYDAFHGRPDLNQRSVLALTVRDQKGTVPTPEVFSRARDQIKTFLTAGHDTTSSALQWLYYELSLRPDILARLREEHESIFGSESDGYRERVEKMFEEQPDAVLQKMIYTTAVFKEVLRRCLIASGSKMVRKDDHVSAEYEGKEYSLDNHVMYLCNALYHADSKYYGPTVDEFDPDRWLPSAEWKIPTFAFRPFERGPRNCIGQELVYLEVKVILAFTIRDFNFEKVFDTKYKEMYSIRRITARPNDGMRMRVLKA